MWRARLRLTLGVPHVNVTGTTGKLNDLRWQIIQLFDPIEQAAWGERFGGFDWLTRRTVRSLDWDTYQEVEK
jgi:hypothetical protein